MLIDKNLKNIITVLSNCPAMYWQNIKGKEFELKEMCHQSGLKVCGSFLECPMWEKRFDCWKAVNDRHNRFNER